jgi:hypothetical protein
MQFKYKKYGSGILRPVIPVEIVHKDRLVSYEVLVDSGADSCIFNAEIGELLGLDIESGERQKVSGITGVVETYYVHNVDIKVGGWLYKVKVGFLPSIAQIGYGVVGQEGFFDIFIIKFDLKKGTVELKERS